MTRLLFASLRTGAALALLPGIGGTLLPLRSRIGIALAIGLLVTGSGAAALPEGTALPLAVAGEVLIGAALGVFLQALFAVASVAGEVLSQSMGLGFATILSPGGMTSPVLTNFLSLLLWAVFLGLDGHARLFALLVQSYRSLPPGSVVAAEAVARFGGFALASGALLALPVATVLLLVNLWLAVLARSAPQLNLFSIGFATLMLAGLAALPLALPGMMATMADAVGDAQAAMAAALLPSPSLPGEHLRTESGEGRGGVLRDTDSSSRGGTPRPGPPPSPFAALTGVGGSRKATP